MATGELSRYDETGPDEADPVGSGVARAEALGGDPGEGEITCSKLYATRSLARIHRMTIH